MLAVRLALCFLVGQLLMTGVADPVAAQNSASKNSSTQRYKSLPPAGIAIDEATRQSLQQRTTELRKQLQGIETVEDADRCHVEVLIRAVELALQQNLFFKAEQVKHAGELLERASLRIARLQQGARGLQLMGFTTSDQPQSLIGGFRSAIDDSVQPFGLVVPAGYQIGDPARRVDVWLHGRGDTITEIPFLMRRLGGVGQYAPQDTFVLHPFGRHCNAFKFAGEVDVYESLEHLRSLVDVDRDRVSIRGFSMGGAGCWHLAVHDPTQWFAANPGAGFVDTIVYQRWQDESPLQIDAVQSKLLKWYDVLPWVSNLKNTRVIAYSGEVDKQRQAAERVAAEAKRLGVPMRHVIGKDMGHKINDVSAEKISTVMDRWAEQTGQAPRRIDFVTYTLRYNRAAWLRVTGLKEHWQRSTVSAELVDDDRVTIDTEGVTQLKIDFRGSNLFDGESLKVEIDGARLRVDDQHPGPGFAAELIYTDQWYALEGEDGRLRKRPGLQGPIDDAFCSRFLFVLPSRPAMHGPAERWIQRELDYARSRWRRLMRGEVREVLDRELTEEQIRNNHLICFGDFQSNQYLREIRQQLPITWDDQTITAGSQTVDATQHAAVLCYPNPRNPERYVVVNSGMTFREFSNVSNSRQIAMLPDWALIDVTSEDDGIFPGDVTAKGFFDEAWRLTTPGGNR